MSRYFAIPCASALLLLACLAPAPAFSDLIDFETLPGGTATVDEQEISTEYAVYGVTFSLLSRETGLPIGFPRIAKAGPPRTAFNGCYAVDTPLPHLDLGTSFLTDGTVIGVEGDLLIEYATPVAQASGIVLDIDCRNNGGPPCEQWTITAYDALGEIVQVTVLDGLVGTPNPNCVYPDVGPGDSEAFGWVVSAAVPEITSIIMRYTGTPTDVGLAFDHFSVAGLPDPPTATVASPADTVCAGERIVLEVLVSGGIPPFAFQWQREIQPAVWADLGTDATQEVGPLATTRYRVIVTDAAATEVVSDPSEVAVLAEDPLCTAELLVNSYLNDRVLRYSFRGRVPQVFVPTGSGGLNGPARLVCGDDGDLYVGSQLNDRVLRYDGGTGDFIEIFVAAGSGGLNGPVGLDFGPDDNLYVASALTHSVLRYDGSDGTFLNVFIPNGSGLNNPSGLVFGPDDDLYICSFNGDKVLRFDGVTGNPLGDFVPEGSGGLDGPRGLVFGTDGHLYVAEDPNDSVRRFHGTTGAFMDVFVAAGSGGLDRANDLTFGLDGALYVCSYNNNRVLRYDGLSGTFLGELAQDHLNGPSGVTTGCQPILIGAPAMTPAALDLVVEPVVPNPFNPKTTASFTLARTGQTRVMVVDVAGRIVVTLLDGPLPAGRHTLEWDGRDGDGRAAPSGVYFLSVKSGELAESAKMLLVR